MAKFSIELTEMSVNRPQSIRADEPTVDHERPVADVQVCFQAMLSSTQLVFSGGPQIWSK